jgi:hypothetical protein
MDMPMELAATEDIHHRIHIIRGLKVMLDRDLAEFYQVETKNLNKAVKRNIERFPSDFMFQLMPEETAILRFQFGTAKLSSKSRSLPFAFTEQGIAMISSIIRSSIAIQINIRIMRAFVEIRSLVASHPEYELLREKMRRIESEVKENKLGQLVENQIMAGKIGHLSREVHEIKTTTQTFSQVLDQFQDAHIIIKRPSDLMD